MLARPVCDDLWSLAAAEVVCGMLCYPGAVAATSASHFGLTNGDYIMTEVDCGENDTSIMECGHARSHWCGAGEGAGVICSGDLHPHLSTSSTLPPRETCVRTYPLTRHLGR